MSETQHQVVEQLTEQQITSQIEHLLEVSKTEADNGYSNRKTFEGNIEVNERTFSVTAKYGEKRSIAIIAGQTKKTNKLDGNEQTSMATWTSMDVFEGSELRYKTKLTIFSDSPGIEFTSYHVEDSLVNTLQNVEPGTEKYDELLILMQKDIDDLTGGR